MNTWNECINCFERRASESCFSAPPGSLASSLASNRRAAMTSAAWSNHSCSWWSKLQSCRMVGFDPYPWCCLVNTLIISCLILPWFHFCPEILAMPSWIVTSSCLGHCAMIDAGKTYNNSSTDHEFVVLVVSWIHGYIRYILQIQVHIHDLTYIYTCNVHNMLL